MFHRQLMNRIRLLTTRAAFAGLLLLTISFSVFAQQQPLKINYRLAMSHPSSHLFEVSMEVELPPEAEIDSLDFQMAKWSPGRYAVFDFAKNVQEFRTGIAPRDVKSAQPLPKPIPAPPFLRVDEQTWRVNTRG